MSSSSTKKVEHKAVYDLGRKELKNRTEIKLDSGLKVGCRCTAGGWVGAATLSSSLTPEAPNWPCRSVSTTVTRQT